jgi:Protein of unknown function (DUF4232)
MGLHARHDSFSTSPARLSASAAVPCIRRARSSGAAGGLAVACGLVLAACASTNAPSSAPSIAPSTGASASTTMRSSPSVASDQCAESQLKVSLTHTGAVAGQAGGYLVFSNDGGASCRMTGWPAVTALTAAGKATPLRHAESTMFGAWHRVSPSPVLTLRPGGAAYAVVASDETPAGSNPRCPSPYVRLRVSPPGSTASVVISAWLPGARTYLPACPSVTGSPTAELSTITPRSTLPH